MRCHESLLKKEDAVVRERLRHRLGKGRRIAILNVSLVALTCVVSAGQVS